MHEWKSVLKADPTDWLLEVENPSVRYFTLRDICGAPADDADALKARRRIMKAGIVPAILAAQAEGGYWGERDAFYTDKYAGTVWQLIILAEHGADPADKRVSRACDFILENAQATESGGFAMHRSAKAGGGRASEVIPCLTGNMAWSLLRLGSPDDERIAKAVEWIARYQRYDDGDAEPPSGWPYGKYEVCWGAHSCHMGVVKALKALAETATASRTSEIFRSIEAGTEYILKHRVFRRSHDPSAVAKPGWLKFGFPLMYQTDVLEILGILARLGVSDERMTEAIDLVMAAQDGQGRWMLASSFNGKFIVNIEKKGRPSKWITLNALRALKGCLG